MLGEMNGRFHGGTLVLLVGGNWEYWKGMRGPLVARLLVVELQVHAVVDLICRLELRRGGRNGT